ncbi:MAG: serpin family protein, partial [Chloroflexota bacterium]
MRGNVKIGLILVATLAAVLAIGYMSGFGRVSPAQATVAQAETPRTSQPKVSQDELAAQVAGNSTFAFDLYGAIRQQDGNLFYSPFSVSLALAMAYAGARGETEAQMAKVLHYALPQDRLHPVFNSLDQQLAGRGDGAQGQDGKGFRLKIANSIWGQAGYQFLPQYLETLASSYGAGLRLADFVKAPEPARIAINDWVEKQTEEKIQDLLPKGVIDELTRLVLVNAIYFNAAWKYPFENASTRPVPFTLLDGSQTDVPMMSQTKSLSYAQGEGYQAVELPYDGDELSMVVLLPDSGSFEQFEGSLTYERVENALKGL